MTINGSGAAVPVWHLTKVGLLVIAIYVLLLTPAAVLHRFDPSEFIVAGDRFVDATHLAAPIAIKRGSDGYDGQFFYRLALAPLDIAQPAEGIMLDVPAYRMQRIGYPLLARIVALGQARWTPASLVFINLAGLAAIATLAAWLVRRHSFAWWLPLAIVAWPGFLIALTHDTAEITAAALMLGALACYLSGRLGAYGVLAAGAALTRETTIAVFVGLLAHEIRLAAMRPAVENRWRRVLPCALLFVPFGIWHEIVREIWHRSPQASGPQPDLGWPLVGVLAMLRANLDGTRVWVASTGVDAGIRVFVVATTSALIAFCLAVASRLREAIRRADRSALAAAWLPTAALMSLMTAQGPWIAPFSYFRAFTECYVLGCLVIASRPTRPRSACVWLGATGAVAVTFGNWVLCLSQLP